MIKLFHVMKKLAGYKTTEENGSSDRTKLCCIVKRATYCSACRKYVCELCMEESNRDKVLYCITFRCPYCGFDSHMWPNI